MQVDLRAPQFKGVIKKAREQDYKAALLHSTNGDLPHKAGRPEPLKDGVLLLRVLEVLLKHTETASRM